jgi:hypothetical protein
MRYVRWLVALGFAVAATLFALLPFAQVRETTPRSQVSFTWTGTNLLFGQPARFQVEELIFNQQQGRDVMTDVSDAFRGTLSSLFDPPLLPQPVFMSAAVFIIAGLAGSILLSARSRPLVIAVGGLGGAATLVVAQTRLIDQLSGGVFATVGPATRLYGFWLVGGLLLALGLAGILLTAGQFRRDLRTQPAETAPVAADLTS